MVRVYSTSNILIPYPKDVKKGATVREPELINMKNIDRKREIQVKYGIGDDLYRPVVYGSNVVNERSAIYERVLKQTPKVDKNRMKQFTHFVKSNYKSLFKHTIAWNGIPMSFAKYLENSNASVGVKKTLFKVHHLMKENGYDIHTKLSNAELYEMTTRKSFVKVENNIYRSPMGKLAKASRLIQGADPRMTVLCAPSIATLQSCIKRDWNKNSFICFTSGVNTLDCANHITSLAGAKYLEDDVSAWDSSFGVELCKLELWLMKKFKIGQAVLDLVKANIKTHGYTTNGFKYSVNGTRKSGDMWTSLFNSVMNGLIHLFIYCDVNGITISEAKTKLRMLVQGDDNLIAHLQSAFIDWKKEMSKLGFRSKALYRENMYDIEFCSMRLIPTKQGWCLVPKPGKVLAKNGYFVNPPMPSRKKPFLALEMVRGTALGLYKGCSVLPPLKSYLDRLLFLTRGVHATPVKREEWQMKFKSTDMCADTWLALEHQYLWGPTEQRFFDEGIWKIHLSDPSTFPHYRYLCDRDTLGPQAIFDL